MPAVDDAALIKAAQAGERDAADALLRRHQDRIHTLCRRLTGNDADALDATQEAMIAIVRGLPRFDGRSTFSTWVYRVTTNACLDELRRRKRRAADAMPEHEQVGDRSVTLAGGHRGFDDTAADRIDLDGALRRIPVEFRTAVVLRDVCRLDYAEIAEVLDVPAGTVRSRISRGRAALAAELDPPNRRGGAGNPDRPDDRRTPHS